MPLSQEPSFSKSFYQFPLNSRIKFKHLDHCSVKGLHSTHLYTNNFCTLIRNFRPKQGNLTYCALKVRLSRLQAISTLYFFFPSRIISPFLSVYIVEGKLSKPAFLTEDKEPHIYIQEPDHPRVRDGKKMNTLSKDLHTWNFGRSFQDDA